MSLEKTELPNSVFVDAEVLSEDGDRIMVRVDGAEGWQGMMLCVPRSAVSIKQPFDLTGDPHGQGLVLKGSQPKEGWLEQNAMAALIQIEALCQEAEDAATLHRGGHSSKRIHVDDLRATYRGVALKKTEQALRVTDKQREAILDKVTYYLQNAICDGARPSRGMVAQALDTIIAMVNSGE